MKNLKRIVIAVAAVMAVTLTASAQFAFGIKVGMNVNSVHFSEKNITDNFSSENRTGYCAGITADFTIPIIGLGLDASLMYVHRLNESESKIDGVGSVVGILGNEDYRKQDFIELPINLKYKLSLPVISHFVVPYITTGPSFAFLCSKQAVEQAYQSRKVDTAWNVGGGVLLLKHLQVGVNYGFGMNKALEYIGQGSENGGTDLGKTKTWTISAAYFF